VKAAFSSQLLNPNYPSIKMNMAALKTVYTAHRMSNLFVDRINPLMSVSSLKIDESLPWHQTKSKEATYNCKQGYPRDLQFKAAI